MKILVYKYRHGTEWMQETRGKFGAEQKNMEQASSRIHEMKKKYFETIPLEGG